MRDTPDLSLVSVPLVLIADDDEYMRELFERVIRLRLPGVRTRTACDGQQALSRATELLPDAILMDITMPVLSGLEAAHRLREQERTRHVPIIAVTGLPWNATLGAPFAAHVSKPCHIDALVGALRAVLHRPRAPWPERVPVPATVR